LQNIDDLQYYYEGDVRNDYFPIVINADKDNIERIKNYITKLNKFPAKQFVTAFVDSTDNEGNPITRGHVAGILQKILDTYDKRNDEIYLSWS
jgi:hypothetical protein